MIIGICGFIGSGKDTVADYLVTNYNFRRESFAGSLKDAVAAVFNWDREMLEGLTAEARAWREQPDAWWTKRLGTTVTPRLMLQLWGTEVCRRGFHDDIWTASVEAKIMGNDTQHVVISDCRFPNEVESIRNMGGKIVRVVRGANPDWYDTALDANLGDPFARTRLAELGIHASETSWVGTKFDAEIHNNGSLLDLHAATQSLVREVLR